MAGTSPQIKAFIQSSYDYRSRRNDKNLASLQRQIQILSVVKNLQIFEPTCMETLEFYITLEALLTDSNEKSQLSWKIIALLSHISQSSSIRKALREEIQLVPVLSDYFMSNKLSADKTLKLIQLIQEISYNIKIERIESWVTDLIPYLVSIFLEASASDELIVPVLSTFANLCRANPPVFNYLRDVGSNRKLMEKCINLQTAGSHLQLLSSEVLLYLDMGIDKMDPAHINSVMDVIFVSVKEGVNENNLALLCLTKDIFRHLLLCPRIEERIRSYKKYGEQITFLINKLENASEKTVEVLLSFLKLGIEMDHSDIRSSYKNMFIKSMEWIENELCGVEALQLLQALVIATNETVGTKHMDAFTSLIQGCLVFDDAPTLSWKQIDHLVATLNLIETICQKDAALSVKLTLVLNPEHFKKLLRQVMATQASSQGIRVELLSPTETVDSNFSFCPANTTMPAYVAPPGGLQNKENVADAIVHILTVIRLFGTHKAEFMIEYQQVLSNQEILEYLVQCQRSTDSEIVRRALQVLTNVPSTNLDALVLSMTNSNRSPDLQSQAGQLSGNRLNASLGFNTSCSSMNGSMSSYGSIYASPFGMVPVQPFPDTSLENVDKMIARLKGTRENVEIKDTGVVDVIEMYEYRMASMTHMELTLRQTLKASDAQNRQTYHSLLQARTQSERLRSLLQLWESRLQAAKNDKTELQETVDEIKVDSRNQREKMMKQYTSLDRENQTSQKEIVNLRNELQKYTEDMKNMKRQLNNSQNENKLIQKQIQELQKKYQDLQGEKEKVEEQMRKRNKETEEADKDKRTLERNLAEAKKEITNLEQVIANNDCTLIEKDKELEEANKRNQDLKRIHDLIHNISADRKSVV